MNHQRKYIVTFGKDYESGHQELEVYAFDAKSAIEVALHVLSGSPTIPQITKIEAVNEKI